MNIRLVVSLAVTLSSVVVLSLSQGPHSADINQDDPHHHHHHHQYSPEDFVVHGLIEIEPSFAAFDGDMYAGVLPVVTTMMQPLHPPKNNDMIHEEDGHLMFWYFDAHAPTVEDTLVVWFNGGPGCSSFDAGLLFEFGPVVTPSRPAGYFGGASEAHAPLIPNPYAWTSATDVLYIEQPVGVGFSYGGREPKTEHDVARDLAGFLQHFYETFPGTRAKRLILAGESYAGMYVSGFAHYIHEQNKKSLQTNNSSTTAATTTTNKWQPIRLSGIAMGNAWIDVTIQGPAVIDYAWWHGLIDSVMRDALQTEWKHCYNNNDDHTKNRRRQPPGFHPFTVPDECGIMSVLMEAAGANLFSWGSPNIYDVSTWDKYDLIISSNSTIEGFFNRPEVRKALNVGHDSAPVWHGCIPGAGRRRLTTTNDPINEETTRTATTTTTTTIGEPRERNLFLLDHDRPISMADYIANLLDDAQIPVLIYNGDRDLSTCAQGSERVLNGLAWRGTQDWQDPHQYTRGVWMVENYPAGYSKTLHNLNFVVVYNSGHLVPMNQPKAALDLLERFLQNESFIDHKLPSYSPSDFAKMRHHRFFSSRDDAISAKGDRYRRTGSSPLRISLLVSFVSGMFVAIVAIRLGTNNLKYRQYTSIANVSATV